VEERDIARGVEPFYLAFGQNVRYYRILRGLSQVEFGKRIAHSKSSVSYFENGRMRTNLETAVCMAKVLGVKLQDLLPGTFIRETAMPRMKAVKKRQRGRIPWNPPEG